MESLTLSLQITLIGMGLVFASLILLWGLMEWLVRLTAEHPAPDPIMESLTVEIDDKQQAAAIAIALALHEQEPEGGPREFPLPPTPLVSAWQAVLRSDMLKTRGKVR